MVAIMSVNMDYCNQLRMLSILFLSCDGNSTSLNGRTVSLITGRYCMNTLCCKSPAIRSVAMLVTTLISLSSVSNRSIAIEDTSAPKLLDLPATVRIKNWYGHCTWASLDTLAHYHNVPSLQGIVRQRWEKNHLTQDPGYDSSVLAELQARKVNFKMTYHGNKDDALLREYANTHGVVVCLYPGNNYSIVCHSIIVTRYDAKEGDGATNTVCFVCTDNHFKRFKQADGTIITATEPRTFTTNREWFDKWWAGGAIVILPSDTTLASN
jgi:hypothetical protein